MAFGVSSAHATSRAFTAQFDNANLNIGPAFDILDGPPNATMTGNVDDVTGAFTVSSGNFVFPPFSGDVLGGAANVAVSLSALQDITGTVDKATGVVTTTASNYEALVTVTIPPVTGVANHCKIDTPFSFSTAADYPAPFKGDAFDAPIDLTSEPASALNNGAIVATWPSLTAVPVTSGVDDCGLLQGLVGGRGGLWIANGLAAPTPTTAPGGGAAPAPTTPAPSKKKKCKKKKKRSASAAKKCKKKKK
jgi:hypothetical protein